MWVCTKCKEKIEEQFDSCWNCGKKNTGNEEKIISKEPESSDVLSEKNKYPSLLFIANLFKILGWLSIIGGIIYILFILFFPESRSYLSGFLILFQFIYSVMLFAFSNIIMLFINVANDVNSIKNK
jgi:uncharacterized membrane protein YvbJ